MKNVFGVVLCVTACVTGCSNGSTESASADETSDALDVSSSSCHTKPGETLLHVMIKVDQYRGTQHGHNGTHEIIEGTITTTMSVADPSLVDSSNVELALNIKSSIDPTGLPQEVPVAVGDSIELEGQYIPAATANAHNAHGAAAVIHFTHSPCGFVTIAGHEYQ
jgi:hypothetical protein